MWVFISQSFRGLGPHHDDALMTASAAFVGPSQSR
jgi:hypothetical protein